MCRFVVSICKQTVELDVPYATFFPSAIIDASTVTDMLGGCDSRLGLKLEAYIPEKVRT
jgi:hypothetical protein